MSPTASDQVRTQIQKRHDKARKQKHAAAQEKYRQKNLEKLREQARLRMQVRRTAIQQNAETRKLASEQRREVDAEYRERQRQKKWIKKFGTKSFKTVYVPLYRMHGYNTSKLSFTREEKGAAEARWMAEGLRDAEGQPLKA